MSTTLRHLLHGTCPPLFINVSSIIRSASDVIRLPTARSDIGPGYITVPLFLLVSLVPRSWRGSLTSYGTLHHLFWLHHYDPFLL